MKSTDDSHVHSYKLIHVPQCKIQGIHQSWEKEGFAGEEFGQTTSGDYADVSLRATESAWLQRKGLLQNTGLFLPIFICCNYFKMLHQKQLVCSFRYGTVANYFSHFHLILEKIVYFIIVNERMIFSLHLHIPSQVFRVLTGSPNCVSSICLIIKRLTLAVWGLGELRPLASWHADRQLPGHTADTSSWHEMLCSGAVGLHCAVLSDWVTSREKSKEWHDTIWTHTRYYHFTANALWNCHALTANGTTGVVFLSLFVYWKILVWQSYY